MPTDRFFGPQANLRTLIANSSTFQTEVGAVDASAALARIEYYSAPGLVALPRPRAILGSSGQIRMDKVASTGWEVDAPLEFEFQRESDPADKDDPAAGYATFYGIVEDIIDDIAELSGSNGFLDVQAIVMAGDPLLWVEDLNDGVEYWNAIISVECGGA